jgi:serine/threonine-protein kinase
LQQLGLKMGRVREVRATHIPAGAVIGSFPKANATVEKGRSVDIEISQGKEAVSIGMPNLTGLSLSQAKDKIRNLGLEVGEIKLKPDARNLPNTVLEQTPAVGSPYAGKVVNLVVSK